MQQVWRIEMLGTLRALSEDAVVTRFRTRRVALLLAYLACFRSRAHFRDEIGELLWPDAEPEVARRNLRQALTSLRHVVEPPPLPSGSVLQVQQARLRLNPELTTTDVQEFQQTIADAKRKAGTDQQATLLQRAVDLYRGELLPGYAEDWIVQERLRLEDLYISALRKLAEINRQIGNSDEAIHYLRLSLDKDRLNEENHVALMREYLAIGRPAAALQQYDDLARQLEDEIGEEPGDEAQTLRDRALGAPGRNPERPQRPGSAPDGEPSGTVAKLPVYLTRFRGRQEEIEFALDHILVRDARLTTLLGPAGTGKTRLAVEVGRRLADEGEWNVWFVPLADLSNGAMAMDAILEVVRARGAGGADAFERLRSALRPEGKNLLILDNLEHIVDEIAPMIERVVLEIPTARILTTSRRLLRLGAEHQIAVPPLPVPKPRTEDTQAVSVLSEIPSVQLFVDRCQAVRPDFQLTAHNAEAIASICSKLEGVPLAIELAAGLSATFPPSQMVYHLEKRLVALNSRRRDMPARHRSLRAAIDYSYETLPSELQRFFASLSVFRGGFKDDDACEVCFQGQALPLSEDTSVFAEPLEMCLDMIVELQERSLLHSSESLGPDLHFRMLESFREYAEERLSPTEMRAYRERHAQYYRSNPPPRTVVNAEERTKRHLWIESEYENYIAATEFLLGEDRLEECIDLLAILASTWASRGPRSAERVLIRRIADRIDSKPIDPSKNILLLRMLGTTYIRSMEYAAAHRVCERALEIAEKNALTDEIAVCYSAIATCAGYLGDLDECLDLNERVLAMVPESNLMQRQRAHLAIGAVHWGRGEIDEAEREFREAGTISAQMNGGEPDTQILYNIARTALDSGRLDDAMRTLGDAMRICRRLHDEFGMATCLSLMSRYHWLSGDLPAAVATGHEALLKYRDADFALYSLLGLFQQALVLTDMAESEAAAILLSATNGVGFEARIVDKRDYDAAKAKIRRHLSKAAYERARAKGLTMDTEEAFRLALQFR